MRLWPVAKFQTSLPDDFIERSEDDIQIGGRFIATEIAKALSSLGFKVTDVEEDPDHGWEFDVEVDTRTFYVHVSQGEETVYVQVSDGHLFNRSSEKTLKLRGSLALKIDAIIRSDDRFSDISWWPEVKAGPPSDTPFLID